MSMTLLSRCQAKHFCLEFLHLCFSITLEPGELSKVTDCPLIGCPWFVFWQGRYLTLHHYRPALGSIQLSIQWIADGVWSQLFTSTCCWNNNVQRFIPVHPVPIYGVMQRHRKDNFVSWHLLWCLVQMMSCSYECFMFCSVLNWN
jgi:hypothetical protein